MTDNRTHEALVGGQFGARAAAYLGSTVHSQGDDLQELVNLVRGRGQAHVLDLGCGAGHVSFNVAPHVDRVVAYDLSPEMLNVVGRAAAERGLSNIVTRQGMAEKLPFADDSFDHVLSRFSTHHWRDLEGGLREVRRVLKPGGIAAFVDSVSPGTPLLDTYLQCVELLRDPSHVRNYARSEWDASIMRAGLVLGATRQHRLRMDFAVWVERMNTPQLQRDAIRAIQRAMSESVVRHYAIGNDGSFDLDVAIIQAAKPAS